jgi:hypothetical protein
MIPFRPDAFHFDDSAVVHARHEVPKAGLEVPLERLTAEHALKRN